jgi:DNA-binding transcriptional ArsR family regulator
MAVRATLPDPREMAQHADSAARLLRALANPHRLQVLCVLGAEELSVGEINERIPLSRSALSQHLKVLREDGLVSNRRESQTVHYRVAPGPAMDVIQVLHRHFCSAASMPGKSIRRKSVPRKRP